MLVPVHTSNFSCTEPNVAVKYMKSSTYESILGSAHLYYIRVDCTVLSDWACRIEPQVAQARYMSSSMLTFALLRDSIDLHIYKDLYGERNKPEKNEKLLLNYN